MNDVNKQCQVRITGAHGGLEDGVGLGVWGRVRGYPQLTSVVSIYGIAIMVPVGFVKIKRLRSHITTSE